jgi:two-component system, response regulator PdtaR
MANEEVLAGKRIVICEDEGITMMQLRKALTRAGLIVVGIAGDGQDATEIVLREKPDIVLMDITMPGMDGLEATRRIMAETSTCVVMLTANTDAERMEKAREYGAAGFVAKPITADLLLPALQQALHMFYECHP